MDTTDLIPALNSLKKFFAQPEIDKKYQRLSALLKQRAGNPGPHQLPAINQTGQEICEIHDKFAEEPRSIIEKRALEALGSAGLAGVHAHQRLELLLSTAEQNAAQAKADIDGMINETNSLRARVDQLLAALQTIASTSPKIHATEDEGVLVLVFDKRVSIHSIQDLQDQIGKWIAIFRNIGRLVGGKTSDIRLISASQGSFLLEFASSGPLLIEIGGIVFALLALWERQLKIKKAMLEVRALELANKRAEKALAEDEKSLEEDEMDKLRKNLFAKYENQLGDDKEEVRNAVTIAIRDIKLFIADGGQIEYLPSKASDSATEAPKISEKYPIISQLSREIDQLRALTAGSEAKSSDNP